MRLSFQPSFFFISAHTLGIPSGLNYQTFSGIQPTSSDFKKGGECHRPSTRPCQLDVGLAKPQASLRLTIMVDSHEKILIIIMQLMLHD